MRLVSLTIFEYFGFHVSELALVVHYVYNNVDCKLNQCRFAYKNAAVG